MSEFMMLVCAVCCNLVIDSNLVVDTHTNRTRIFPSDSCCATAKLEVISRDEELFGRYDPAKCQVYVIKDNKLISIPIEPIYGEEIRTERYIMGYKRKR